MFCWPWSVLIAWIAATPAGWLRCAARSKILVSTNIRVTSDPGTCFPAKWLHQGERPFRENLPPMPRIPFPILLLERLERWRHNRERSAQGILPAKVPGLALRQASQAELRV